MASGGRAKKFRGNHTHGRGKKAGRGAGLRGGRGRAGANKHRYLMLQLLGGKHEHTQAKPWGRTGFKYRSRDGNPKPTTLNVGDLATVFPGMTEIDLTKAGYGKLLGAGEASGKLSVTVESASAGAVEKIQAAGGKVILPEGAKAEPAKPAAAGGAASAPAKPASAGGAAGGGKPASGDKAGKAPKA